MMAARLFIISLVFSGISTSLASQGKLMLAGGGGESSGGWSDIPYAWVVDHSDNKRVAVISYSSQTEWVPNYFKSFGAVRARNFYIPDRVTADKQETYDSLISYDAIFMKGGDQFVYYDRYKGTKTQEALQYVYDHGGTLSGTSAGTAILSPIVFTAEVASVDPGQALINAYSSQMTLEDDFLQTLEGRYIFDSHFAERGRFGRLPAFVASWYKASGEKVTGIGVDDHNAFCVDKTNTGTAYGSGAVSILTNRGEETFDTGTIMPRAKRMKFTQLIHGCSIDLLSGQVSGYNDFVMPEEEGENGRYIIYFTGTDFPSEDAYSFFVNSAGSAGDSIVIVTGLNLTRADDAKTKLESAGATNVAILQALSGKRYDPAFAELLNKAGKIMIISNSYNDFIGFANGGGNGARLRNKLEKPGMISFFVGDNARFAGKTVVEKYISDAGASYNGLLEFKPGLALLGTTAIMPNAFVHSDYYENTVTGIPYAMVMDALRYGVYVTGNTFAGYTFTEDNKSCFTNISGTSPLICLENKGCYAGLADQGPGEYSRNIAGFESMDLSFLAIGDTLTTGTNVPESISLPQGSMHIQISPNPASEFLSIKATIGEKQIFLCDLFGRVVLEQSFRDDCQINVSTLPGGIYLARIYNAESKKEFTTKIVLQTMNK